jgi:hypothetical protein
MTLKLKDILQKLSFIKDYSSLVVPAVIAAVAVVILVFTQLMSSKLREQVEKESISQEGKKISSLVKNAVASNQWEYEQQYQDAYEKDANQIALLVKQTTERQLLSYKIFPEPKDPSPLIFVEFGQRFRSGIERLVAGIRGGECPTEAELGKNLAIGSILPRGSRTGRANVVNSTIKEELCQAKAKSASVYCNPTDLVGYGFWEEYKYYDVGKEESVRQCWYWQLGYWIIEDVIDTISAMNSTSENVLTSPVKRLLGIEFASEQQASKAKTEERPRYVLSGENALVVPYTRRYCNNDTDIVHFRFSVLVSAKAVLPFMTELCSAKKHEFNGFSGQEPKRTFLHNQITILESNIRSINRESAEHELYRYGDDAVVELDLACEYLFSKSGYEEIKPESIKKELAKAGGAETGKRELERKAPKAPAKN